MSVTNTPRKAGPYTGNNTDVQYTFGFKVFADSDLVVTRAVIATGAESTLVLTTDYSVTRNADQDNDPGGYITLTAALADTYTLTLTSAVPDTQPAVFTNLGGFFPAVLNNALDRLTILVQQLKETVSRSLKVAVSTPPGFDAGLPAPVPYGVLGFNGAGTGFAVTDPSGSSTLASDLLDPTNPTKGAALIGYSGRTVKTALDDQPFAGSFASLSVAVAATTVGTVNIAPSTLNLSDLQLEGTSLRGAGPGSILKASGTTTVLDLGYVNSPSQWTKRRLSNLTIDGNSKASDGITLSDASSAQISGRWALEGLTITGCKKGIHKPYGSIGNAIVDTEVTGCDYGYYAVAQASPLMHAGCDSFDRSHFDACALAAVYIDSAVSGTGADKIANTIFEQNPGFGVFVKNWTSARTPFTLDNVWFEANATSGSVTVNGTAYTPVDLRLENAAHVVLVNGVVPKTVLVNSHLTVRDSLLSADIATWSIDATSTVLVEGARMDGGVHPVRVSSVATAARPLGNQAAVFYGLTRSGISSNVGNVLYAQSFDSANTYSFTGTGTVTATRVADGLIFDSAAEGVFPVSTTEQSAAWTLTNGKWYVFTCDIKHVSGTLSDLSIDITGAVAMAPNFSSLLATGKWVTVAAIGQCTAGGVARLRLVNGTLGNQTVRFSALQVIEFDTEAEACAYFNSGEYRAGTSRPRTTYSTVAPTTGTWAVGDRCINAVPTVGQPKAWSCTVAGTPGTWTSEGNL